MSCSLYTVFFTTPIWILPLNQLYRLFKVHTVWKPCLQIFFTWCWTYGYLHSACVVV